MRCDFSGSGHQELLPESGVRLESASPPEGALAEDTLAGVQVPRPKGRPRQKPKRAIADRTSASDPLRERLKKTRD